MNRRDWTNRCARQLRKRYPSMSWPVARMHAGGMAEDQAENNGASGIAWQSPEDAADEADDLDLI